MAPGTSTDSELCSLHCILYIVHCTLQIVHCTLHIVHCTLHTVQYTFYSVESTQSEKAVPCSGIVPYMPYIVSSRAPVRAKTIRAISTYIFLHIWAALYAGICSNRMDGLKFDQKHIGIKFWYCCDRKPPAALAQMAAASQTGKLQLCVMYSVVWAGLHIWKV